MIVTVALDAAAAGDIRQRAATSGFAAREP
jgi:hypothetical protein